MVVLWSHHSSRLSTRLRATGQSVQEGLLRCVVGVQTNPVNRLKYAGCRVLPFQATGQPEGRTRG